MSALLLKVNYRLNVIVWFYKTSGIFYWDCIKCRLWTADYRLLILGLENNGPIVVKFSFAK